MTKRPNFNSLMCMILVELDTTNSISSVGGSKCSVVIISFKAQSNSPPYPYVSIKSSDFTNQVPFLFIG